jgi:hypothetical protein
MTTSDKITMSILGVNAVINVILIKRYDQHNISKKETQAYSHNFWEAYLLFVPFFVTQSIIKEIENKKKRKNKNNLTK